MAAARLARQAQSRATLAARLERIGFEEQAVLRALDRLEQYGYLDDRAYAQALVRRRSASRGKALIARELHARGIAQAVGSEALAQVGPEDESEQALRLARSLIRRRPPLDRDELRRRVGGALGRRGYPSGLVHRICEELWQEARRAQRFDTQSEAN